jgi:hypothetical protein
VFYFVWGNCLVAFGFVISTFFRVVKNAVVFGYIYTIGSGVYSSCAAKPSTHSTLQ